PASPEQLAKMTVKLGAESAQRTLASLSSFPALRLHDGASPLQCGAPRVRNWRCRLEIHECTAEFRGRPHPKRDLRLKCASKHSSEACPPRIGFDGSRNTVKYPFMWGTPLLILQYAGRNPGDHVKKQSRCKRHVGAGVARRTSGRQFR